MKKALAGILAVGGTLFSGETLYACSVCFGDPNSLQSKALVWGVMLLFGVTIFILGSIAWILISWTLRARRLQQSEPQPQ